ncbi:BgTH12-05802 [Blumeria graminis f. sp. triticale]|uniref:BgTH12-05801 n=1 Tax=Blumeria graminis f. sp. triticale TaxID=1689686 RepID=A0A9W4GHN3_BLUGR|nr:BgTH12-05801 [Blumeria graminis f. sp. triticale]CAD6504065.1 BgTH12-05802 [Blumeria graminis f. sp. triticale]
MDHTLLVLELLSDSLPVYHLTNLPSSRPSWAKKAAIFFIEEFKVDNVRHMMAPTSLQDLFQGFDAVGLYMYGIEFCYFFMCYIGKFAQEYRKEMDTKEKDFFWERVHHYRKILLDDERLNPLKRLLDPSLSSKWPFPHDNQTRSKRYEPEARRNSEQNRTIDESNSPSDLFTNPMCRLELENPSPKKYTRGSSFMIFNKCKNCKRSQDGKETLIIITESDEPAVNNEWSGIPKPKLSTPLASERIFSSTASSKRDSKSTYIPHVRSSDLVGGKSKIPRLMRPKFQAAISCSTRPRKKPAKWNESNERKENFTAATVQSKNIRKPNLPVPSQKVSPPKTDRFKKTQAPCGVVEPIKKIGQVNRVWQKKPWV